VLIAVPAFSSMAEESDLTPSPPHDEDENNDVPNDINSDQGDDDQGDDETEDELSEVEGSDASEDSGSKKKKKKKKVCCHILTFLTARF